jgi:hypothetical protein
MATDPKHRDLLDRREALKARLAAVGDMRPGSLVGRYRKCGKPGCHCAQPDSPGHGPSWSLTRQIGHQTKTRIIPAGPAVQRTQAQIAEYRRFRELSRELVEISEQLCDAQLAEEKGAPAEAAEKRGSARRSKRRSAKRSKPS